MSDLVKSLKESSKWVKARDSSLRDFYWQEGYGAFSVSPSHVEALQLKKYNVEYDEKYVWD